MIIFEQKIRWKGMLKYDAVLALFWVVVFDPSVVVGFGFFVVGFGLIVVGFGSGLDVGPGGFFWLATTLVIVPCKWRIASKIIKNSYSISNVWIILMKNMTEIKMQVSYLPLIPWLLEQVVVHEVLQVASDWRPWKAIISEHSVVQVVSQVVPGLGPGDGVVLSSGVGTSWLQKSS